MFLVHPISVWHRLILLQFQALFPLKSYEVKRTPLHSRGNRSELRLKSRDRFLH